MADTMTSRQRMLTTINHDVPDRVPLYLRVFGERGDVWRIPGRGTFVPRQQAAGAPEADAVMSSEETVAESVYQAISTGEEIMRDYPNSRMSQEVRQKMPQLRANASASAQAPAP